MPIALLFRLLRRRRAIVCGALAAVIAAAWAYLWFGAGMHMSGGQMMTMPPEWSPPYAALIFVMWVVMMAAMMLPGVVPTVMVFTVLAQDHLPNPNFVPVRALLFTSGYLLVCCGFGLVGSFLQWRLDEAGLLSPTMALSNAILASTVLMVAGVYQWTPFKDACLRHCRSPSEFVIRHLRQGALPAVSTGMRHGLFCLGCCWMLMAMLFVGGLMNLAWIAAIALLVLLEKTIPGGGQMSRLTGAGLIALGAAGLVRLI